MDSNCEDSNSNVSVAKDASSSPVATTKSTSSVTGNNGMNVASTGSIASSMTGLDGAKAASPSVTPTATVSTPKSATSKTEPAAAGHATTPVDTDTKRLNINNVSLTFNTIESALSDGLMGREPLSIEDDDIALVKTDTHAKAWVKKLINAFGQNYLTDPEDTTKNTPAQKDWFNRWQKQGHVSVLAIFETSTKGPVHLEKSCWHLFSAVVKAHELGVVNAAAKTQGTPSQLKCSARLTYIVTILEKYALIRLDVLRAWHTDEIAANPEAFIKRKITNCWNNGHRAERLTSTKAAKAAEAEAKATEGEAKGKGVGRKRKSRGVEGQTEAEQDAVETPVKGKKARKSRAAKGDEMDVKKDDEVKGEGKSSTKRVRSTATAQDSSGNEPTSRERRTSHNTSSADGVKAQSGTGSEGEN